MFGNVVMIAFQITFRTEIHGDDVFLFFKNYFWYQHIKTIQNIQNFSKKKIEIFRKTVCTTFPNGVYINISNALSISLKKNQSNTFYLTYRLKYIYFCLTCRLKNSLQSKSLKITIHTRANLCFSVLTSLLV